MKIEQKQIEKNEENVLLAVLMVVTLHLIKCVKLNVEEEIKFRSWSQEQQSKHSDYHQHYSLPASKHLLAVGVWLVLWETCGFPHPATAEFSGT